MPDTAEIIQFRPPQHRKLDRAVAELIESIAQAQARREARREKEERDGAAIESRT